MSNTEQKTVSKQFIEDLLELNNLDYKPVDQRVLAKSRTLIKSVFNKTSYSAPSERATCYFSYGDSMIDPYNSYLKLEIGLSADVETVTTAAVTAAHGSALNIIDNILLRSRSGENIERSMNINVREYHLKKWRMNFDERDVVGSAYQLETNSDYNDGNAAYIGTFCIPLSELGLGLFRPERGVLLPAKLVAGMMAEITFSDNWTAFTHPASAAAKSNTFTVSNLAFVLDSVVMSDQVNHLMNQQSASKMGLNLSWKTWAVQHSTITSSSNVDVSFRSAVSDALRGVVLLVDKTTPASAALKTTVNRMNSMAVNWTGQQFKYGNQYYPLAQTVLSGTSSPMEGYIQALYGFDVLKSRKCGVKFSDFEQATATSMRSSPVVVNLQPSSSNDASGQIISSGRALDFTGTLASATTGDVYFFVQHLVKCKVFSSKIVIDF